MASGVPFKHVIRVSNTLTCTKEENVMRNFIIGYIVGSFAASFAMSFLESRDNALRSAVEEASKKRSTPVAFSNPEGEPHFSA
jgi:hypothetical protein